MSGSQALKAQVVFEKANANDHVTNELPLLSPKGRASFFVLFLKD